MIPDRLQYFLDDFWNFEKVVKIWTRRLTNYYKMIFKNARNVESSLEILIFVSENMKISNFRKSCLHNIKIVFLVRAREPSCLFRFVLFVIFNV